MSSPAATAAFLFGLAVAAAPALADQRLSVWEMSPDERQVSLREGATLARQVGGSYHLGDAPSVENDVTIESYRALVVANATRFPKEQYEKWLRRQTMVDDMTDALRRQAAANAAAMPSNLTPEQQLRFEQWKASQAVSGAVSSSFQSSYQRSLVGAAERKVAARVDLVVAAAESWQAPQGYSAAAPGSVPLLDPFATVASAGPDLAGLGAALAGTCLGVDEDRGVARVDSSCDAAMPCLREAGIGDYPFLEDGLLIADGETAADFIRQCASAMSSLVVRGEGEIVVLGWQTS